MRPRDQAVRVARVGDGQHPDRWPGRTVDRLPLPCEDRAIGPDQVGTRHPVFSGQTANQDHPVGPVKRLFRLVGRNGTVQERKCTILELHQCSAQGRQRRRDFQQLKRDRLIRPERRARGQSKKQRVPDLPAGAGDGDANGFGHGRGSMEEVPVQRIDSKGLEPIPGERSRVSGYLAVFRGLPGDSTNDPRALEMPGRVAHDDHARGIRAGGNRAASW